MKMLLFLTFLLGCAADDGCLELHPPRVVVKHGDPVSANCIVSTDHIGMGWAASVNDVPITRDVKFLTWRVESLRIWDLKPQCFVNRPGKPLCKERLSVTVYKPPDSVSVSSVNSNDSMVEGSQYQLKCEIQNIAPVQNLTVKWYKGDTLVHKDRDYVIEDGKSDREKAPVSVSSTLLITPSRADDGAEYSCGAELDLGLEGPQPPLAVKSTPLNTTVHYPPVIKEGNVSVTVPQGGTVSLPCSAEGNPPPQVRWSYRDAENVRVTSSGGNSTAVIREASSASEGVYSCTATNRLGSDTATVFVTVTSTSPPLDTTTTFVTVTSTGPPLDMTTALVTVTSTSATPVTRRSQMTAAADICLELHPPRAVVRYGDQVSANCTVSTDHIGMGWAAPVNDVPPTRDVKFLTWRVESLRIWDLKPQCYVNRQGKPQCKDRLSVTVYKPPDSVSVSSVNSNDSMVEGSQYQLKCEIQNIAPVQNLTVKWYKGDTLVHKDRDCVIEDGKTDGEKAPVNVSSTLLITPSRADDGAEYSCGAELDLGPEGPQPPLAVKSTPLIITVHYPPKIKEGGVNVTVHQGGTVSLPCSAEGNPPAQVRWSYRDAENVRANRSRGNSTVVITKASTANEGVYNCTATNRLGSDTATAFVTVTSTSMIVGYIIIIPILIVIILCILMAYKKKKQRGSYAIIRMQQIKTERNGSATSLPVANGTQY